MSETQTILYGGLLVFLMLLLVAAAAEDIYHRIMDEDVDLTEEFQHWQERHK